MLRHNKLVIWYNPNKDVYYYKKYVTLYQELKVGFKNGYGHEVCLVIPVDFKIHKEKLRKRLIKRLIAFLEKFI